MSEILSVSDIKVFARSPKGKGRQTERERESAHQVLCPLSAPQTATSGAVDERASRTVTLLEDKAEMKVGKIRGFSLEADRADDAVYSRGQSVCGRVVVELRAAVRVRSLAVYAKGMASVHWLESRSVGMNTVYSDYSSFHTYFKKRQQAIPDNGEVTVLQAGRHEFPFSFQLPEENLVTSFEGKHGSVRYWVKAKLHRPWATVKKIKREFTVIEPIDINTPSLLAPQAGTKEKLARVWYCNLGHVSLTAKIDRKGYTPGEVIPIFAEVDNCCSRTVMPKAAIVQMQTFIARGTMKQKKSVVATLQGEGVATRKRGSWHGRPLKIPPVSPSLLQCRVIRVEYVLRLPLSTQRWFRMKRLSGRTKDCPSRRMRRSWEDYWSDHSLPMCRSSDIALRPFTLRLILIPRDRTCVAAV
uniref:arrestin domain-containing protein 2 isoform X2 n=1 Tax=Pristiophorus japonicus TaxID=55135 RepID=UPI00398E95AD